MKRMILGSIVIAGALAGFGCEASVRPAGEPAPVVVGGEVDLGVDAEYYDRGAYVGDVWVWHDHQGREMREDRKVHENRRSHAQKPQEHHEEHHEEHHDDHK